MPYARLDLVLIELPGRRPTIHLGEGEAELIIPARRPWAYMLLLLLVAVSSTIAVAPPAAAGAFGRSSHPLLRTAAAVALFATATVSAIFLVAVLWFLGGSEKLIVRKGRGYYTRRLLGFPLRQREYRELASLRVAPLEWLSDSPLPWHACIGLTGGSIVADTASGELRFGGALEVELATEIASVLNDFVRSAESDS